MISKGFITIREAANMRVGYKYYFRWLLWACLLWSAPLIAGDTPRPSFFTRQMLLNHRPLELHLANFLTTSSPQVLVLYASGDGGWFGAAVDMYEDIARLGYTVAGFSTRSYMKGLGYGEFPVTVPELTEAYHEIAEEACKALNLPLDLHVILTGWSRGAAFSVLVASEGTFRPHCAGVVAIGLPAKEELKIRKHGKKIFIANFHKAPKQSFLFETYERIPEIAPHPCALIQSEHDDFLPAVKARALFGADSEVKKFFAIPARNHRFSGGSQEFRQKLAESLSWIVERSQAK
jgi:hypothetical protein